jgi:hypothetical protein
VNGGLFPFRQIVRWALMPKFPDEGRIAVSLRPMEAGLERCIAIV